MTAEVTTVPGRAELLRDAVRTEEELREIIAPPSELVRTKHTTYLTPLAQRYITFSPFFLMATAGADGTCDVTPRGDAINTIQIVDERTIVVPDRPGNRRVDSFRNILANPNIGLLFVVPGIEETLRVNGRATLTRNDAVLDAMVIEDKRPVLGVVVEIDEVFMHCARSFLRAKLWQPGSWPAPAGVPTLRAIMSEQRNAPPPRPEDDTRNEDYRTWLY
ncbi:MSMEG_1061 family FMN-dependent PPOX-type flavoprotein [Pseudonocardia sp. TRM90224]|uniref:MSMEG_1061 family FMN-dependent PPOX-type flavoprotein n=1 Tax=Pseudonocardia sp. TRM90224 TaxID=2812678 RepID=UPI001E6326D1|nr:MSMEG_1061 family FMN-dependent PPOX-type flavoprotein [Pseudonocardia sp. TRM90224]